MVAFGRNMLQENTKNKVTCLCYLQTILCLFSTTFPADLSIVFIYRSSTQKFFFKCLYKWSQRPSFNIHHIQTAQLGRVLTVFVHTHAPSFLPDPLIRHNQTKCQCWINQESQTLSNTRSLSVSYQTTGFLCVWGRPYDFYIHGNNNVSYPCNSFLDAIYHTNALSACQCSDSEQQQLLSFFLCLPTLKCLTSQE